VTAFFEMKTDPANMTTNSYITSECFYGIRSVYIDEEDLTNALELNYKQFAIEVIENIKLDNPDITVNITLPQLAEGTTLTNDIDLDDTIDQHIVKAMASIVATGGTGYTDSDFKDLYALIDFFGLTEEQLNKTKDYISQYFTDNNILQGENINVNTIIEDAFTLDASGEHDLSYITNICQKVMIKDEIATEEGLSDIKTRHYIASIYMPNKDINVTRSYYTIYGGSDTFTNNYKLIEENNGEKTIHAEKEMVGDSEIVDGFLVGTAELKQFTSIITENPNLFSSGISLFEAVKLTPKGSQYFQKIETKDSSGNTVTAYTWNPTDTSLLYLTFEASSSFIFTEFSFNATAK
ncbi:MAG: hypothetical protein IJA72_00775, partial [Clostridia bacterium]|nr:hypothetical protein [Clostridia bacterium]